MRKDEEVKPCRLCGKIPTVFEKAGLYYVKCDCGVSTCLWGSRRSAIARGWNELTMEEVYRMALMHERERVERLRAAAQFCRCYLDGSIGPRAPRALAAIDKAMEE